LAGRGAFIGAALRHQLMVLQRKVRGRVHFTNSFLIQLSLVPLDHKLIFSRCLHRQVGRLLAFRRPI
jgi:hypothetical protein